MLLLLLMLLTVQGLFAGWCATAFHEQCVLTEQRDAWFRHVTHVSGIAAAVVIKATR